jgi:hypothetical protein
MRLTNHQQAANTRVKLAALEAHYQKARERDMESEALKQLTLYSLRRSINDLKEELIRFECDLKAGRIEAEAAV